jgi:hypothetical protein
MKKHFWITAPGFERCIVNDVMAESSKEAVSKFRELTEFIRAEECQGCPECKGITYDLPPGEIDV